MSSHLYLDHNSLAYAYQGGGTALLDRIAVYAAQQGYELRISDVVRGEIEAGPLRKELGGWLQSKGLSSGLPTQTLLQVITGEIPSKSAGDVSIVELAKSDIAAGNRVTVWADDEFFTRSQNLRGLPNGFNSTGVQGTSTLINQMAADGAMTPGEYVTTVESFRSKVQPFIQDPREDAVRESGSPEVSRTDRDSAVRSRCGVSRDQTRFRERSQSAPPPGYESRRHGFESLRARHSTTLHDATPRGIAMLVANRLNVPR
ncbi:hypothetical protein GWE18_15675 [Bradyrhizobium sp. CSA112]|uniref:hypothetical protein n=1 Tax=Bradyrhizobium sp. CSA112 TaxID=2699170 RepID=UPI0023AFB176|nr:hypothetical protein [Bradyrhizobium sp. CSA112]MDE5454255.1 hypothetical protein [Bradyrhizobium sp. CSA112]